jgi:hypothetical protein
MQVRRTFRFSGKVYLEIFASGFSVPAGSASHLPSIAYPFTGRIRAKRQTPGPSQALLLKRRKRRNAVVYASVPTPEGAGYGNSLSFFIRKSLIVVCDSRPTGATHFTFLGKVYPEGFASGLSIPAGSASHPSFPTDGMPSFRT